MHRIKQALPLSVDASVLWVCVGMSASHSSGPVPSSQLRFPPCTLRSLHCVQPWSAEITSHGSQYMSINAVKKKKTVLTDHSPWRRWGGWSGQCSLEERQTRWPRCTRGSECCALSTSSFSSASGLRTSGTPSRMDLPMETRCDHPGIIGKVSAVGLSPLTFRTHLKLLWCPLLWDFLLWSWWWWACQPWADNRARTSAPQGPRSPEIHRWNTV